MRTCMQDDLIMQGGNKPEQLTKNIAVFVALLWLN